MLIPSYSNLGWSKVIQNVGSDLIYRFGGEQFAIILPETTGKDAQVIADRILKAVNEPHKTIKPYTVTAGIACYPHDNRDQEALIQIAENALQFGKHHSDQTAASSVMLGANLSQATDQERLEVFTAQIAKKYGETGSDLFESLLKRHPEMADNLSIISAAVENNPRNFQFASLRLKRDLRQIYIAQPALPASLL